MFHVKYNKVSTSFIEEFFCDDIHEAFKTWVEYISARDIPGCFFNFHSEHILCVESHDKDETITLGVQVT